MACGRSSLLLLAEEDAAYEMHASGCLAAEQRRGCAGRRAASAALLSERRTGQVEGQAAAGPRPCATKLQDADLRRYILQSPPSTVGP